MIAGISDTVTLWLLPKIISPGMASPRRLAVLFAFGLLMGTLSIWGISALILMPSTRGQGKCPHCRSLRIRTSWPRISDRFLPWLRAYRCEACLRRFYLLKRPERRQPMAGREEAAQSRISTR